MCLPFWISISIGHYWAEGDTKAYNNYAWEGFGIFFLLNVLGAIFIAMRRDIIWSVSAAWLAASVWKETPKSAPVSVSGLSVSK